MRRRWWAPLLISRCAEKAVEGSNEDVLVCDPMFAAIGLQPLVPRLIEPHCHCDGGTHLGRGRQHWRRCWGWLQGLHRRRGFTLLRHTGNHERSRYGFAHAVTSSLAVLRPPVLKCCKNPLLTYVSTFVHNSPISSADLLAGSSSAATLPSVIAAA